MPKKGATWSAVLGKLSDWYRKTKISNDNQALLRVSSVVLLGEPNYLINPEYRDAVGISWVYSNC